MDYIRPCGARHSGTCARGSRTLWQLPAGRGVADLGRQHQDVAHYLAGDADPDVATGIASNFPVMYT